MDWGTERIRLNGRSTGAGCLPAERHRLRAHVGSKKMKKGSKFGGPFWGVKSERSLNGWKALLCRRGSIIAEDSESAQDALSKL